MRRQIALARLAGAGMVLFVISGVITIGEIGYFLWGQTTTAEFKKVQPVYDNRGPARMQSVKYAFIDDDGHRRVERNRVPLDWKPPANGRLRIEYVPGTEGKSRLAGSRNDAMVYVFFGTLAFSLITFCAAWHQAYKNGDPWKGIQGG
jgi:hypothetical protein